MMNDFPSPGSASLFMGSIVLFLSDPFKRSVHNPCSCLQAEEFHSVVHVLLEWLAEAEQALRFHGILPDDEEALRALIDQHRVSKITGTMLGPQG